MTNIRYGFSKHKFGILSRRKPRRVQLQLCFSLTARTCKTYSAGILLRLGILAKVMNEPILLICFLILSQQKCYEITKKHKNENEKCHNIKVDVAIGLKFFLSLQAFFSFFSNISMIYMRH